MSRIEQNVEVLNALGLHARPASLLVRQANSFKSAITLSNHSGSGDCKSVLELLMLTAGQGTTLKLVVEGTDAEEACRAITGLFLSKFGED